ncbi:hypothetical protein N7495_004305 [Penicillium taxi]|uniref:uncharacterized protein n=1 Tax=Penicillium taxi TaxID=168475 RepID=UPI002544FD50|nr:uncharacterized protein N7495_004305 [Penicillium taxi]KAJ5899561.1 hypothetical protein N7495_004305 [Penicillium taxi]
MNTLFSPRGHAALAIIIVFTTISTILASIRVFTRAFIVRQMGADDWMIIVALWVVYFTSVSLPYSLILRQLTSNQEVFHGMGEHYLAIPEDIYILQMKALWAAIPSYQTSLFSTKLSIVLLYQRIFQTPRMHLACSILFYFLICYAAWTIATAWAICVPVAKFWYPSISGFCFDKKALWFSNSAIHITTDILLLVYPMPLLKSLQLPRKQKLALMAVFALGGFVVITSILRLQSLLRSANSTDPTYDNLGVAEWSGIECNVAIICTCLPSTRAFMSRIFPHVFSTRSNGYRSKTTEPYPLRSGANAFSGTGEDTHIQACVIGGQDDYALDDLTRSNSQCSDQKPMDIRADYVGIKVTTSVQLESTSHIHEDGMESTQDLVRKQSV